MGLSVPLLGLPRLSRRWEKSSKHTEGMVFVGL